MFDTGGLHLAQFFPDMGVLHVSVDEKSHPYQGYGDKHGQRIALLYHGTYLGVHVKAGFPSGITAQIEQYGEHDGGVKNHGQRPP